MASAALSCRSSEAFTHFSKTKLIKIIYINELRESLNLFRQQKTAVPEAPCAVKPLTANSPWATA
jgi:hypothetical protein